MVNKIEVLEKIIHILIKSFCHQQLGKDQSSWDKTVVIFGRAAQHSMQDLWVKQNIV